MKLLNGSSLVQILKQKNIEDPKQRAHLGEREIAYPAKKM